MPRVRRPSADIHREAVRNVLVRWRGEKGWSQEKLEEESGVSRSQIARWETADALFERGNAYERKLFVLAFERTVQEFWDEVASERAALERALLSTEPRASVADNNPGASEPEAQRPTSMRLAPAISWRASPWLVGIGVLAVLGAVAGVMRSGPASKQRPTVSTAAVVTAPAWLNSIESPQHRRRVWQCYLAHGGEKVLGPAVWMRMVGGALQVRFKGGAQLGSAIIDWDGNPEHQAVYIAGALMQEYQSHVEHDPANDTPGLPLAEAVPAGKSPRGTDGYVEPMQRGYLYFGYGQDAGPHWLRPPLHQEFQRRGSIRVLGYPVYDPKNSATYQRFQCGTIKMGDSAAGR